MDKLNPEYVAGLVDGEGCFCVSISKHKTKKSGFDPRLMFEIEMVIEDKPLLDKVRKTFGCGNVYILNYKKYGWKPHAKFAVKSFKDIRETIIPFFKKHSLIGKKRKDFELFSEAGNLFEKKLHLTAKGVIRLRKIQSKMNLRRKLKYSSAKVRENRAPGGERSIVEQS